MLHQNQNNRMARSLHHRMAHFFLLLSRLHHPPRHSPLRHPLLHRSDPKHLRVSPYLSSSCFLATPKTQIKDMFKKTRWVLTLVYLGSIVGTIVMAFLLPDNLKGLIIIMLIIQIIAYYLYTLSFVPFGRKILKKCC